MNHSGYRRPRSPEDGPVWAESGDDRLSELLSGLDELAQISRMSASDYIEAALERAKRAGIETDEPTVDTILQRGFGTREDAFERIIGLSAEEFSDSYPGQIGELLLGYVAPLFDE